MATKRKMLLIELDTSVPNKQLTGSDAICLLSLRNGVILDTKIIQIDVKVIKQKGGKVDAKKK